MPSDPELQHSTVPGQEPATAPALDVAQSQDALAGGSPYQQNRATSVHWNPPGRSTTPLSGTLTVAFALESSFSNFVYSGVAFDITAQPSATTVDFNYEGPMSLPAVAELLVVGAELYFCP